MCVCVYMCACFMYVYMCAYACFMYSMHGHDVCLCVCLYACEWANDSRKPFSLTYFLCSKMDGSFGPAVLASLLPLGSELLETLSPSQNSTHAAIFKDFFDCLVALAGTNKGDGHLQLVRAVGEWLPRCVREVTTSCGGEDATPTTGASGERETEMGGDSSTTTTTTTTTTTVKMASSFAPVSSLFQYLSQLTTAVQFSCSRGEYVEKRGVAGEDDPLFDEDDGGEEAGLGGSGGGADEEDATNEESVSVLCIRLCRTIHT